MRKVSMENKKIPFLLPIMVGHAVIDFATVMQILATSAVPGLYEQMCTVQ